MPAILRHEQHPGLCGAEICVDARTRPRVLPPASPAREGAAEQRATAWSEGRGGSHYLTGVVLKSDLLQEGEGRQ